MGSLLRDGPIVAAQPDGKKALSLWLRLASHAPPARLRSEIQVHRASSVNAAATISASAGVVGRPQISAGVIHRASLSSSLSAGSPASQRAAKHSMTKW